MEKSNTSSGGIGFLGLLFIVFLVLKLTNVIDWSWWWVTAPLWGGLVIAIVICAITAIIVALSAIKPKRIVGKHRR